MENRKLIWSDASLPGLVLGAIPVAYFLLGILITKMPAGLLQGLSSALAWIAKFVGCIWLFRFYMKRFASDREDATNSDTMRFGIAMALYSAFIVALFQFLYCSVINPEYLSEAIETALREIGPQLDSNSLNAINDMMPSLPKLSFISNFIWCFIFGAVLSAIFSRKIPSTNPFD